MKKTHLTTMDLRRERVEAPITSPTPGPQTRDLRRDKPMDLELCLQHALPSEWQAFREKVMARVASRPRFVMMRCSKCGFVSQRNFWTREPAKAQNCIKCNWGGFADGGFMRDMTAAEVESYKTAQAKADAETDERYFRAALFARNQERQRQGLSPLSPAAFRAEQRVEWQRRQMDEARMGGAPRVAALPRAPRPDAALEQGADAPVAVVNRKVKK